MKNFTNNFKQFTSRLSARWLIMALMLLVGTSSAWALSLAKGTYYFDNSITKFANCYLYVGTEGDNGKVYCYQMSRVAGTKQIYSLTTSSAITHNGIYVCSEKWWDSSTENVYKFTYHTTKTFTDLYKVSFGTKNILNWSNGYVYIPSSTLVKPGHYSQSSKEAYSWNTSTSFSKTLTLTNKVGSTNTADAGTIEVTRWNSTSSSAGSAYAAWKSTSAATVDYTAGYKTALQITATPKPGYELVSLTVNGTSVSSGHEFEVTAATTIIATWKAACSTPAAPTFDKIDAQCGSYTLPTEDKNKVSVNWYTAATGGEKITSVTTTDTYYAEAVDGTCVSENRTDVEITIKTKPSISSINQNVQSPVPFEDVVLIADGVTPGAEVNWYVGENLVAENTNTYTVTSDEAGEVIVKAKAFLNGCESAEVSKKVTFGAEDCGDIGSNNSIIITCDPGSYNGDLYCYIFGATTPKGWSDCKGTKTNGIWKWEFNNINEGDHSLIFHSNSKSNGKDCKTSDLNHKLQRGYQYDYALNGVNSNWCNEPHPTIDPVSGKKLQTITAPAVKMISAEYDEVNDKIVANGAVYKTGCGETFWGFQYSTDGQWGTADADFIRPSTGNSLSVPGEFDYSFPIPDANGGETYYIRAYALNNYNNDDYNLSSAVYSTTYLPVEIPSKTINSATISLVDSEGNPSDVTEVCPQSTVYLKVSYDGGDFKDYEAADNFPGTNLELVNHDKAHNYAIFSYTATATGVANITISNDNTSIAPTNGVNITLIDVTPVNAPMISISQGTICEDGSATITVDNPIENLTYTLYKETEPIGSPVNYQTGDLTFDNVIEAASYTVRAEESICHNYAKSMAVELKVVTSDVKIGLAVDNTTVNPWQPLKLTVTPPEGYAYTIDGLADVVYTQSGDVYTIKIPRPNAWSPGNSGDPVKTMPITFSAKIQVTDDLTCGTSSVNVTLSDTEENCK